MNKLKTALSKSGAELRLMILCKQIVQTKWYQYRKRKKLREQAEAISKKYFLNF